ncbi:MAG: hypothetical protein ACM3S1_00395 [Hyphomicrobiales bacterium]
MALQNRVTPFGEIVATSARGTCMGNRGGRIHTPERELTRRRWASRQWICCVLEFRGRHREVMSPNSYTELFFLDEATALAAGHRPCFECRRADALRFREAFASGNPELVGPVPSAAEIDRVLHDARVQPGGGKRTYRAALSDLPPGTMVGAGGEAWLLWDGALHRWSFEGYRERRPLAAGEAEVLTPRPLVRALRAGYVPAIHASVR